MGVAALVEAAPGTAPVPRWLALRRTVRRVFEVWGGTVTDVRWLAEKVRSLGRVAVEAGDECDVAALALVVQELAGVVEQMIAKDSDGEEP